MDNRELPKKSALREYVESFLWAIFFAFLIRSFIIEPYRIPSGSMIPTLLVGDHIFVNKFSYGLRLPGTTRWIRQWSGPQRGEVIVFIYPDDKSQDYIKRVVGLPNDHIEIRGSKIYVNGLLVPDVEVPVSGVDPNDKHYLLISNAHTQEESASLQSLPKFRDYDRFAFFLETLGDIEHYIQHSRVSSLDDDYDITVPPGHYFVMGDNRDNSQDSRYWGFVPRENLKGRAWRIWLSLEADAGRWNRWERFFKEII